MPPITPTEALARCIEHREIFHDEMLELMRMLMRGEMSPQLASALLMGLRVKKETVGEITAAAQVMREFALAVDTPDPQDLLDMCGTGGDANSRMTVAAAVISPMVSFLTRNPMSKALAMGGGTSPRISWRIR